MNKQKLAEEFKQKNGACDFDFKGRNLKLYNGGLFAIEKEKVMRHRMIGTKKLPNGFSEVLFSKSKYPVNEYNAWMYFEEVDEHINYFRRLKKLLNKLGYKTGYGKKYNNLKSRR